MMKTFATFLIVIFAFGAATSGQSEVIHKQFAEDNLLVKVRGEEWQPDGFDSGLLVSTPHVPRADIVLDGRDDEPAWMTAPEMLVPLQFGQTPKAAIKAIYTDREVFIRVRWADGTMDREHHPWVWDAEQNKYVSGPQTEDSLLLSFEMGCEWNPSILAGYQFDFDGWHWRAARSDPVGQAWDIAGNLSYGSNPNQKTTTYESRHKENAWILKFRDIYRGAEMVTLDWQTLERAYLYWPVREEVSLSTQLDFGEVGYRGEHIPAPATAPLDPSDQFSQYKAVRLEGPAGEVAAKGHWENGYWTVEFRRDRITPAGTANDTVFNRATQFSIHIFDGTERFDEAAESTRLFLNFLPPESLLVQD